VTHNSCRMHRQPLCHILERDGDSNPKGALTRVAEDIYVMAVARGIVISLILLPLNTTHTTPN